MTSRYKTVLKNPIIYTMLILLFSCGKDKQKPGKPPTPPPVANDGCRLTYYSTTQNLGDASYYGFSYDTSFNLVAATAFNLQYYNTLTVKIGPTGINRDNHASIVAYNYPANIYTENPSIGNTTIAANITLKRLETYKYDSKKRLIQVDIADETTGRVMNQIYYTYDDNDNNVTTEYVGGDSKLIQTVKAKYDDHPSAYINIKGRKFMHWIESFEVWNSDFKFTFDMMSDHNILEWSEPKYDENGVITGNYKATFVYTYYPKTGRPETRVESYYEDGVLKGTYNEIFSYTGCD